MAGSLNLLGSLLLHTVVLAQLRADTRMERNAEFIKLALDEWNLMEKEVLFFYKKVVFKRRNMKLGNLGEEGTPSSVNIAEKMKWDSIMSCKCLRWSELCFLKALQLKSKESLAEVTLKYDCYCFNFILRFYSETGIFKETELKQNVLLFASYLSPVHPFFKHP